MNQVANLFAVTPARIYSRYQDSADVVQSLKPDSPLYLFSAHTLEQRARRFINHFPGVISYAIKANPRNRVLRTLSNTGIGHFDVASISEVAHAKLINPAATLHFNNPIKAFSAIETAYFEHGVRSFALDDMAELDKIQRATRNANDLQLSVRFKLKHRGAAYDFGSKFGANIEDATLLLAAADKIGAIPCLTFHPGSQCSDPMMYHHYIEAAATIATAAGVKIVRLNVGGGFPEHYQNSLVAPLETYFETIQAAVERYFPSNAPELMCEPGRGMVASSVSLLARVIHVRETEPVLYLNDGIYGGLQEQIVANIKLPIRVWRNGQILQGKTAQWKLFGPTCDPVDCLPKRWRLPKSIVPGDFVEFGLIGAYGSATTTEFNGFVSARYVDVEQGFSG